MHQMCCCQMKELKDAEELISKAIMSCDPRDWDEDFITRNWLREFRDNFRSIPFPSKKKIRAEWDAYKMTGGLETDNGDIAFIVKIFFKNNHSLTGVGFLEAKRIYDTGKYDALKWEQLVHMSENFSAHQLLLYNKEKQETLHSNKLTSIAVLNFCKNCSMPVDPEDCFAYQEQKTNATVVPSAHALHYEIKSKELAHIGYPLSEQILHRYFYGLDLNFNKDLVANVISGVKGGVDYLVMAKVLIDEGSDINLKEQIFIPSQDSGYGRFE